MAEMANSKARVFRRSKGFDDLSRLRDDHRHAAMVHAPIAKMAPRPEDPFGRAGESPGRGKPEKVAREELFNSRPDQRDTPPGGDAPSDVGKNEQKKNENHNTKPFYTD